LSDGIDEFVMKHAAVAALVISSDRGPNDEGLGVSLEREPADVVEVWLGPLAISEDRLTKGWEFRWRDASSYPRTCSAELEIVDGSC